MSQRQRITIAQQQRLALNTTLSASIRLLRSDAAGLARYLEEQAAQNPHIRLVGPEAPRLGDWLPRWSGVFAAGARGDGTSPEPAAADASLTAHVIAAVRAMSLPVADQHIALALIEALEPTGWLGTEIEAIARDLGRPLDNVLAVLSRLQKIDPPGLFARNLAECLALQAADQGKLDREMRLLLQHLDLLAAGDVAKLCQICDCDDAAIAARFRLIRTLNPKPGTSFSPANPADSREPDLIARPLKNGRWSVSLNRSALPSVEVDPDASGTAEGLKAAKALRHMVTARNSTLLRVGKEIVARQAAALLHGPLAMQPMTMADLAETLELHVSTISRVVAGASLDGPQGVVWLRRLFSGAPGTKKDGVPAQSAAALRSRLKRIVSKEDPTAPLSDAALGEQLAQETNVRLARRTIALYRDSEGIPPAHRRRQGRKKPGKATRPVG